MRTVVCFLFALLCAAFANSESLYAATITVTSTADPTEIGQTTLRDALAAAVDGDTIDFSVAGTITLTMGQLEVDHDITISGPGADVLTVSGNNASRVFYVNMGATVEINALTIADGSALGTGYDGYGAGIYNDRATVAINDSVISGNNGAFGGGIYQNSGATTVTTSTVSGNSSTGSGGGIVFVGTYGGDRLEINSSSISGNSAGSAMSAGNGGGIYFALHGILRVKNSTISDNSAFLNSGGGIAWIPFAASMEIVNSTVSGNTAAGAAGISIYCEDGTSPINITDSTIANNASTTGSFDGGGIRSGSYPAAYVTMTLNNAVVSGNTAGGNPNDIRLDDLATTLVGSNNIVSVNSGFVFSSGSNNQLGVDPLLGPLQDNGGPTFTHALLGGSPAIDAGNNSLIPAGLLTDQRGVGFARIVNGTVDIGAFEVQPMDSDGDGVPDSQDVCPGTVLPEEAPEDLKRNHYHADANGDFVDADGTFSGITVADTGGCSGIQIIEEAGLGKGLVRFGITRSALLDWIASLP